MRMLRVIVAMFVCMSLMSGCFGRKGIKDRDTGSYVLTDFPLEKFKEASNDQEKVVLKDVHFDYNKSDIKTDDKLILKEIAKYLKYNNVLHLLVEGHCDERGTNEFNLALGEKRALNTREYLVKTEGIESARIQTISYGEEKPLDVAHNDNAWKVNRRSHFQIASE